MLQTEQLTNAADVGVGEQQAGQLKDFNNAGISN